MIRTGDSVAIAVSGGKDSIGLLHLLNRLTNVLPAFEMRAITIDEGIDGYRDSSIKTARRYATMLQVKHRIVPFKKLFGYTLDEIVASSQNLPLPTPCSICSVLKRRAINLVGRELGCNRVVTAHNLDDEAQTFMMNILDGNPARAEPAPIIPSIDPKLLPRAKPLFRIPEREMALYAYGKGFSATKECPYGQSGLRKRISHFLNQMEGQYPDVKYKLISSLGKISKLRSPRRVTRPIACSQCGEPSSREICVVCELLNALNS